MMRALRAYVRTQQFDPGIVGLLVNPFYHARRGLYCAIRKAGLRMKGSLLDVGCGRKPYQALFQADEYIGLEIDTPENRLQKNADYYYDGESFPFSPGRFDGVICNQVLEHVFAPDRFLAEIRRVLCPGGQLLLTVPFVWDEHEQPWDYARYSTFGLKSLLERNGFEIIEQCKINADVRTIFQLINAYLYKILWTRGPVLNLLICVLFMAPANILGALLHRLLPENPDLYLDQLVLARKAGE